MYGGQAVIEGVMMRSPRYYAVACRKPDGTLTVMDEPLGASLLGRLRWLNRPFLRGSLALVDALALGLKALSYAANVQAAAEAELAEAAREARGQARSGSGSKVTEMAIGATLVLSLALGAGLFVVLPTLLTQVVQGALGVTAATGRNVLDGVIRITIFLTYVSLISTMHNIRRVFQYHGAEHKAINTFEAGRELTLENAVGSSRIHPRCGTSFVVVVLLATIIVHSIFPRPEHALVRVALHLALLPLVAGASYELIRWAGRCRNSAVLRVLLAPGLWSQALTTREPTPDQVEVALAALQNVIGREQGSDSIPSADVPAASNAA
ncbi:MAG: DUF1385 domain-containing protein [Armatimonadetes bacterium]|nr:DUF1385 domain-containing protein [Armatimonadota bacterium]